MAEKDVAECRTCKHNCVYHGGYGCLRALVKGKPENCTACVRSKNA